MVYGLSNGMHIYSGYNTTKKEYLKGATHLPKISLEWLITRLGGQDKLLWREAMRNITLHNGILTRPIGNWKVTGHIQ